MRKMRHILYSLLAASLMTACTQDEQAGNALPEGEYPLVLYAGGLQVAAAPDTRGIFDGDWSDVTQIAVMETSTTSVGKMTYKVTPAVDNSTAELAPLDETNTIWWNSADEVKAITAWHPADEAMPQVDGSWTVTADQRDGIPVNEDLLYASGSIEFKNRESATLAFRHLLSKVVINLRSSDYLSNYSPDDVTVTMGNMLLNGKFKLDTWKNLSLEAVGGTGTEVTPHRRTQAATGCFATYEALVMPQSVTGFNKTIIIQVGNTKYVWTINMAGWDIDYPQDYFASGSQYTFNITVDAKGLEVSVAPSSAWTDGNSGSGSVILNY